MKVGSRALVLKLAVKLSRLAFVRGGKMAVQGLLAWKHCYHQLDLWLLHGSMRVTDYANRIILKSFEGFLCY